MHRQRRHGAAPVALVAGFVIFLLAIGYIIAASVTRRHAPTFAPTAAAGGAGTRIATRGRPDTLTVDASDPERWRFVALSNGAVSATADSAWDVALRRYHIISAGALADLGRVPFDSVRHAPDSGFVMTRLAPDSANAAIERWYNYGMLTHLLESKQHVYVLRAGDGRTMKLQVLSYYCPGLKPGCVTLRYEPL